MVEANESSSSRSMSEDKNSSMSAFALPLNLCDAFLYGAGGAIRYCLVAVFA